MSIYYMFMGAMLGVVFSDNMMVLYVFWELTSISSFLLIAFWYHRKQSRYGAQKSLLITVTGGVAMLIGFVMLHAMTGSFSIRENISAIGEFTDDALFIPAMFLFCSVHLRNLHSFLSIFGCQTRWRRRPLLVHIYTQPRW